MSFVIFAGSLKTLLSLFSLKRDTSHEKCFDNGHLKMRKDSKGKHDTLVEYAIQTNSNTKDNS